MERIRIVKVDTVSGRTAYGATALWMGLPFIAVGGYFALGGSGFVVLPGRTHAPLPVLACVGIAFFMAGAIVAVSGVRGLAHRRRGTALRQRFPDQPWYADFPWDESGCRDRVGARVGSAWQGVLLLGSFLAPFNWWAFFSDAGNFFVIGIVVLFDLGLLLAVGAAVHRTLAWLRYGSSSLRFRRFPFHPGESLDVTFLSNRFDHLTVTLRCVEERFEVVRSGRGASTRLVADALYQERRELDPAPNQPAVELHFDLPADPELVNDMRGTPVRYWELLLESAISGVDYRTTFLLPVYARQEDGAVSREVAAAPLQTVS